MPINVATVENVTLKVDYSSEGLIIWMEYESGYKFPWFHLPVSWAQWERLVAWVELQRKEQALREAE